MGKLRHLKLGAAVAALAVSTAVVRAEEQKPDASVAAKAEAKSAPASAGKDAKGAATAGAAKATDAGKTGVGKTGAGKSDGAKAGGDKPEENKPEEKKSFYVPTRGYRLEPQPDIPPYVRNLGKTYPQFEGIDWLNVGLDSRVRFEYRHNDYRPWTDTTTNPPTSQRRYFPQSLWLSRTRVYLGVQNILDPFRAVVEFQDSRAFNNIYQLQGQEINEADLISAYGELYFKDALGKDPLGNDRPLTLRAGRFHLELLDRRLIAENEFRNTTNNFDGFRIKVGKKDNDWDLDSFLMRPVIRYPYQFDRPDWQNWVYGSVFSWRGWSEYATIQPYFLGRTQFADQTNVSGALKVHRETYAPGLRVYGVLGNFDYDFDINKQFGAIGRLQGATINGRTFNNIEVTLPHDAIAYSFEAGYTVSDHPWKPRISAVYVYGSGNKSAFGYANNNFDIFYGFNQPFSRNDYFAWNNIKDPKVRLEFTPTKDLRIDTSFSAYWLASAANAWDRANLFAPLGNRGTFLGTEFDIRARYKLSQFINLTASYARFWPGAFTSSFAPPLAFQIWPAPYTSPAGSGVANQTNTTWGLTSRPTDFFYLEASVNAFGDGQPITKDPVSQLIDGVHPAKPAAPPSWRDVYVGLNGGGAWSNPNTTTFTTNSAPVPASEPITVAASILDPSNKLAGFLGGLQLGANWRIAETGVVAGVEADLHGVSGNTATTYQGDIVTVGQRNSRGRIVYSNFQNYGQRTTTLNYLGTVRGRLGYLATPTLQIYGTGGLAYGGVISNTALFTLPLDGRSNAWTLANAKFADTLVGWTAGGGVEWAFMPNWSAKAEYLYYNLGTANATAYQALRYTGSNQGLPYTTYNYGVTARTNFDGNLVQAGINRHFDLLAKQ